LRLLTSPFLQPLLSHDAVVGLACGALALVASVALLPIRTGHWAVRMDPEPPVIVSVEKVSSLLSVANFVFGLCCVLVVASHLCFCLLILATAKDASEEALLMPRPEPEMTLAGLLRSWDFYLLFFVYMCGVGPSIAVVNNMFSVVMSKSFAAVPVNGTFLSLQFPEPSLPNRQDVATFVALFSSVNTLGRLGFGFLSDRLQERVGRHFWLLVSLSTLIVCNAGFTATNLLGFYPLVIAMGLAYGGLFAVVPSIVADSYGERNFGLFYGN
jgi:nitrate/nitrite transporter NarK